MRFPSRRALVFAVAIFAAVATRPAVCAEPEAAAPETPEPLNPNRYEVTAVPAIAFDSDTGLLLGGFVNIAKFAPDAVPYAWRLEVLLSASVKHDSDGFKLPLHNDSLDLDLPGLMDGVLRVGVQGYFGSYRDEAWYGPGGTSGSLNPTTDSRYFNYSRVYPGAATNFRFRLWETVHGEKQHKKLEGLVGAQLDYSHITAEPGGLLATEIQEAQAGNTPDAITLQNILRGTNDHVLGKLRLGLLYDSRDNEFQPTRGFFMEASTRIVPAPSTLAHAGFFGMATGFLPLFDGLVLGGRAFVDAIVGTPPFYALTEAGVFNPINAPGGSGSLRGVLAQRYAGKIKAVASGEIRSQLFRFTLLQQRFRFGISGFVDAGRAWADWHAVYLNGRNVDSPYLRLATGVGGGLRLVWGETLVVRADFAWSPSDHTFGQYINVGELF